MSKKEEEEEKKKTNTGFPPGTGRTRAFIAMEIRGLVLPCSSDYLAER